MNRFIQRYATPLTTGFFLVSTVSGVALFFHWAPGIFHAMHEWLSMVLLAPFALHLVRNWRGLVGYLRRRTLVIPLALSLVVAVPFAAAGLSQERGGNPAFRAVGVMTHASLATLAPVLDTTPEALIATLARQGHASASPEDTLTTLADASGESANELLFRLLPSR